MKHLGALGAGLLVLALAAAGAQSPSTWEIESLSPHGQAVFQPETGLVIATNLHRVKYGDSILTANRLTLNRTSGQVTAEGDVMLQSEGQFWRAERLEYNFLTKQISAAAFRAGRTPFFASGEGLKVDQTNQVYTATNALLTTDDVADPFLKVRAKHLEVVPGQSFKARGATMYLGEVPVMYFPFYQRSLERHPNHFQFTPGFRSAYGAYLLGSYHWYWREYLNGALHLDYREQRGVGLGPYLSYDLGPLGYGALDYYFLRDEDPGLDPKDEPIRDDRHRFSFSHLATVRSNLTAKLVVNEQSDAQFLRDFFEHEYRQDTQPKTFLEVNQLWPDFSLNLLAQPQANEFFETVERLPDLKLTAFRQQLGRSPFYYESESSAGYFRRNFAEDDLAEDFSAFRGDSFHQLVLPKTFFGWLNIAPRVGSRFTYYGETEGKGSLLHEEERFVFNTGAEASFKASRVWNNIQSRFWEMNGLRHIIQPAINYVFVPSPNRTPRQLPQFDRELPSLRLLPIEFPDFNSIDSIDSQNVLRLSLRNRLQTKRNGQIDDWLDWAIVTDWRMDPRSNQSSFSDLFSEFDFRPRSWLTLTSDTRFDPERGRWRMANHTLTLTPNPLWSWSIGHRFLRTDRELGLGNNIIASSFYFKLSENWGARISHHFEARDGTLEEQYYTIYRDLRSWTSALTFRVRDHRRGPTDFTVAITFSLKAFPRFGLGDDSFRPSLLLGG